jgi:hypothetical protein
MLGRNRRRVNERIPEFARRFGSSRVPGRADTTVTIVLSRSDHERARRLDMGKKRLLLAGAALAFAGLTGCQTWFGGLTLPSGRYLEGHYPQYFPPDPLHPLPRELASQEDPEGAARRAGFGVVPAPAPPAPPVPAGEKK